MKLHIQKSRRALRKDVPQGRSRFYMHLLVLLCVLGLVYLVLVLYPRGAW